mmetsp:Transcript_30342/g.64943  ORF Transcript_30342/g.64943 Transcript_30342/m.64943 type:complete len:82 (+) Transcript_30342:93-338(+)
MAVLVALVALALFSRVNAQTGSRRERIRSALESLSGMVVDDSENELNRALVTRGADAYIVKLDIVREGIPEVITAVRDFVG